MLGQLCVPEGAISLLCFNAPEVGQQRGFNQVEKWPAEALAGEVEMLGREMGPT